MRSKKAIVEKTPGPFDSDPVYCGTCGQNEATHEIWIKVRRGLDYNNQKPLYEVTYSVCGPCAREVVEVKLGAKLNVREG
jgi:hypothetical protein